MKIAYIAAGAANMYCGSCLHDNTLAAALLRRGEEILLIPTYTPLRTDEPNVSQRRLFLGGINVYLQQKSALFRHTPRLLDRWLDEPRLVSWLASRGISTKAEDLGDLTVSMLEGEHGHQHKEVARLVDWLANHVRPNVIHLSNTMLAALAEPIRRRMNVPIVCSLSGEDIFLEKLVAPHYSRAHKLLKQDARHIDRFVALNRYYAEFMSDYLAVDRRRIEVIPHGLHLDGYITRRNSETAPFTIGYLARIDPDKGLHHLVDAFRMLASDDRLPPIRLRVAGYLDRSFRGYLDELESRLKADGCYDRFEYVGEVDRAQKLAFLGTLDVMSVPTVYHESKGLSILEAWAAAVPVVLPAHGAFPEMVEDTGGGIVCQPESPTALAAGIRRFIEQPELIQRYGSQGQRAVHDRYTDDIMAENTLQLYRELTGGEPADRSSEPPPAASNR